MVKSKELVEILKKRLPNEHYEWQYEQKADKLRLDHIGLNKGMEISLPEIIRKYNQKKEAAIDEVVYTINATFRAMEIEKVKGFKDQSTIYPVIRSTSFAEQTSAGHRFVMKDHTAETRIYYALDLGETYRLIDESMLEELGKSREEIIEIALFNVRSLSTKMKTDEVAGNIFYFVNNNDGYDASRILNRAFLADMAAKIEGDMTVSVPHQDVLIIGDIRNKTGYDVLAQMTLQFFTNGIVPVTSLSFVYEDEQLEPIFIMAKNRVARKKGKE
ncbi:DUF1444 domain-containing protein [Sporosarcina pasteurii]|uniref:Uncharacterized protein conserved in bacteria n=1 Tax=Sporosarcina pasteurii TaxID=1474 RepID=A0A380C6D1_SPOPA|nr:DUF1444 domain-containing protein [Sporosarcina pasteurii]MDS9471780.1 DUF1444 domain-containing protein [Sporosarcina pasteurii]SUJ13687.1 Uncharacterized protein conserved in bacteria [Sporosarcina pasteurii]